MYGLYLNLACLVKPVHSQHSTFFEPRTVIFFLIRSGKSLNLYDFMSGSIDFSGWGYMPFPSYIFLYIPGMYEFSP
ncbi:hypothetical protein DK419_25925 [Methylobacterium terrae]|uniref:Uncharacterized protein n=1 Tax=Methylobacterium terrae TaxID=2202827 RepID=A0A2U8WV78_9HYPH|nr:hypothetical protein DK419_25925 [Methylobacterium terrae]